MKKKKYLLFIFVFVVIIPFTQFAGDRNEKQIESITDTVSTILGIIFGVLVIIVLKLKKSGEQEESIDFTIPCPKCSGMEVTRVKYTWWGGPLLPKLFNWVKCKACGTAYNRKTGGYSIAPRILINLGLAVLIFLIIVGVHSCLRNENEVDNKPGAGLSSTVEPSIKDLPIRKLPPDGDATEIINRIIETAERTYRKFAVTPAKWQTIFKSDLGVTVHSEVFLRGNMQRFDFTINQRLVCRIIMRDNLWYVTDFDGSHKTYRPFEGPLQFSNAYVFIPLSFPVFFDRIVPGLSLKGLRGDHVVFWHEKIGEINVHTKYGYFSAFKKLKVIVELKNFKWLPGMSDEIFSVKNIQWKEFPGDVLTGNLNELVMIHHSPLYTPESRKMGEPKLHTCVFNIETGRFKRIPFPDGEIQYGGFSPDRKKVYASGIDVTIPQWDIFEINLQRSEIRNLTAGMLEPGLIFFLTLSPDGNTLVFMYKGAGIKNILLSQVYLLNLKSNKLKKLGQPIDAFYFSWLPSGKGLLLRKNIYDKPGGYSRKQICRLDFNGTLTPVIEGDSPVLLEDRQLILFIGTDNLWYICDLNGKNKKMYIDGLKGYGFPALSPDGKRILWIRYETGKLPVPLICEIGKKHGIKMTTEPGLWTIPTWK